MNKKSLISLVCIVAFSFPSILSQQLIWSSEAENGILEGDADINNACSNASEGAFVRLYSDPLNGLTFSEVSVPKQETYRLAIDYFYVGSQPLEIFVNGTSAGIYTFPNSIWCYQGAASIMELTLDLNAGTNTISFKPANGMTAPFLDKLALYEIEPPELRLEASSTRTRPGSEVQITVQSNYMLKEDSWAKIEISGIDPSKYTIGTKTLNLLSGQSSASTTLIFSSENIAHGTEVGVSIQSAGSNVSIGEPMRINIRISDRPELMYISSTLGDDLNSGISESAPWSTLEKASSLTLFPGDSLLFRAGDIFIGQFRINGSGDSDSPVYIGKYGEGDDPVLDGAKAEGGAYSCAVLIENADHIAMQHLTITNDRKVSRQGEPDEDAYGIQVLNSGDQVMEGFHFSNLTIDGILPVSIDGVEFNKLQTAAIYFYTLQNTEEGKEKNISDVIVENCYITHTAKAGIWSRHNNAVSGLGNDSINRNLNLVLRDNHFFETGGSGIILSRSYNCLLERNIFEYTGSDVDPRMAARGSGAWFWNCRNVLAQYNSSMHVRGPNDSYGMHIDFANEDVFLQYNYSEDSEGGFVEILGDNINSVYRFNVSVNDGFRDKKGNSIWVSDYANPKKDSDKNYVYNNTVYVDGNITPDIFIKGVNTYIYNNIFYATGNGHVGQTVDIQTASSGSLNISNNLFYGNISENFKELDSNPVEGDPLFSDPGVLQSEGYTLKEGSIAMNKGKTFEEPVFPAAGKGIFKDVPPYPTEDHFGNPVSISSQAPHIGAYAGSVTNISELKRNNPAFKISATINGSDLQISWDAAASGKKNFVLMDIHGRVLYSEVINSIAGKNEKRVSFDGIKCRGVLLAKLSDPDTVDVVKIPVIYRY